MIGDWEYGAEPSEHARRRCLRRLSLVALRTTQTGVYPNPSASRSWTDAGGTVWHRRGERGEGLGEKRVRALLRKPGLPLVTWSAGVVTWFDSAEEKQSAASALQEAAEVPADLFAVEWKSDDGEHMLMLSTTADPAISRAKRSAAKPAIGDGGRPEYWDGRK